MMNILVQHQNTTRYAIATSPLSGVPPMKPNRPPSSEATAINPPCGEAKTAQAMNQEIYEVFKGASNQELKFTL